MIYWLPCRLFDMIAVPFDKIEYKSINFLFPDELFNRIELFEVVLVHSILVSIIWIK